MYIEYSLTITHESHGKRHEKTKKIGGIGIGVLYLDKRHVFVNHMELNNFKANVP